MSNALSPRRARNRDKGFLERHLRQDGFDVVEAPDGDALALLEPEGESSHSVPPDLSAGTEQAARAYRA